MVTIRKGYVGLRMKAFRLATVSKAMQRALYKLREQDSSAVVMTAELFYFLPIPTICDIIVSVEPTVLSLVGR